MPRLRIRLRIFVLGFQRHRGSPLPALMDPWPSLSGFGSGQLPRNHPHVAVLIFYPRVTHIRPSELLERKNKDLVPSLVPLLPCLSAVITTYETKVCTKTGVRGPRRPKLVSVDQQPEEIIWNFNSATKLFRTATDSLGLSGMTRFQTRTGSWHSARNPDTTLVTPLSLLSTPKQSGNTRATC